MKQGTRRKSRGQCGGLTRTARKDILVCLDDWRELDVTQLNLDRAVAALVGRLLEHIEVPEAEIVALRVENQALRDENAHLKGQKGRPFTRNLHPGRTNRLTGGGVADSGEVGRVVSGYRG